MSQPNGSKDGVNTPHSAALTGLANIYKFIFVTVTLGIAWLLAVVVAVYFSLTAPNGSFGQALATNSLAGLLLLVVAPFLFSHVLRKSFGYSVGVAIIAVALLGFAVCGEGALRDILINLGTGLLFVLAIDFHISHRFGVWRSKLAGEAKEAAENIHLTWQ